MQIYGLPQGNVADVGGAIEGGTNFKQRQELFKQAQRDLAAQRKQEQQQAKFKKLYAGVKAAEQSPGVLNVLARDFPEYATQAQELLQLAQTNPQGYQAKIRELQGVIGMQAGIEPQQPGKMPNAVQEYQFARQQGYQGSFEEWKGQNKGGVNINQYPAPEKGYRYVMDNEGRPVSMEPIPGSPAAREAENVARADEVKRDRETQKSDLVSQEIERTLSRMESGILPDTGWGAMLKNIPGTDAKAIDNLLSTIKANIGFDTLQGLRDASPTGGALGQVSERELGFLQSVAGSLDQSQDDESLGFNLKRLWNAYQDVIHGPDGGPQRFDLTPPEQKNQQQAAPPKVGEVVDGWVYIGGPPGDQRSWQKVRE